MPQIGGKFRRGALAALALSARNAAGSGRIGPEWRALLACVVCAVRFGGAGAFAPAHTRARTVEGLRPLQCQCQCQKSKKKPQPIKTAGVIGQVSKSIRQKNVRNRKSVTVTVDQGATIVYNDYVATGGPWQGLRRSARQCQTPYRLVYILYILYMLKSTGIKILNVCIQTGVLLSVAYPFF